MSSQASSQPSGGGTAWRCLVDENLPRSLADSLRTAGYTVEDVRDVGVHHRPDAEVWAYAQAHQQTVITQDAGFGDIRQYPPPHAGIVIVDTPERLTVATRVRIILEGLAQLRAQTLSDAVVTIEAGRVRVRR